MSFNQDRKIFQGFLKEFDEMKFPNVVREQVKTNIELYQNYETPLEIVREIWFDAQPRYIEVNGKEFYRRSYRKWIGCRLLRTPKGILQLADTVFYESNLRHVIENPYRYVKDPNYSDVANAIVKYGILDVPYFTDTNLAKITNEKYNKNRGIYGRPHKTP